MSGARARRASHRRVALALFAVLSAPAFAATRTPSPPPAGVTQFYAALRFPERVALETDLIWMGHYEGVADGEMSASAIAAVRAFQSRNGGKPTGVLNPQEQKELAVAARTARQAVGGRLLDDPATGVRLGVPTKFVTRSAQGANTSRLNIALAQIARHREVIWRHPQKAAPTSLLRPVVLHLRDRALGVVALRLPAGPHDGSPIRLYLLKPRT